jgi:hypothetical protein
MYKTPKDSSASSSDTTLKICCITYLLFQGIRMSPSSDGMATEAFSVCPTFSGPHMFDSFLLSIDVSVSFFDI